VPSPCSPVSPPHSPSSPARSAGADTRSGGGLVAGPTGNPQNRRVKPPLPWAVDGAPLSVSSLQLKRATFWETAVAGSGRRMVWENLKVVAEAMLAGDIPLANSVLEAADLRVPHGDLSVVYDALGQLYQLPRYVYSTPTNVLSDEQAAAILASSRKEHVGPVVELPITLRLSPSTTTCEQDIKMSVKSNALAKEVKASLHDMLVSGKCDQTEDASVRRPNRWGGAGLPAHRQRLMRNGRELGDEQHMQECGIAANSLIQVFIRPE
jgi:hypothetical protein